MNDSVLVEEIESIQNLYGKSSDEFKREALIVVAFYEFIEVHTEQFKNDALG